LKGIVAFDSVYGNTKQVAEAIAEALRVKGHDIEIINLGEGSKTPVGDFMFIGSPTRIGMMTGNTKKFVKGLDVNVWKGRTVVAFDTIMAAKDPARSGKGMLIENGAGPKLREMAEKIGLKVYPQVLRTEVAGLKGPLAPGAIEKAKAFANEFAGTLSK
jgi:flavodoxin